MLIRFIVKGSGGFWRFRGRVADASGLSRRALASIYKEYLAQHGAYISLLADFADEPTFPHGPHGVFIAPRAKVGRTVTIYQHVMLAMNDDPQSKGYGAPTIGDGVLLGAGAIVIGNVTVGDGAKIGAGAIVSQDVPAAATVVSQRALILAAE